MMLPDLLLNSMRSQCSEQLACPGSTLPCNTCCQLLAYIVQPHVLGGCELVWQ